MAKTPQDATEKLEIIDKYPGTNSSDSRGATPGTPNSWLTLDSPLDPFKHPNGKYVTSNDCINIEQQLGYTYTIGSLEEVPLKQTLKLEKGYSVKKLAITKINRGAIRGSFYYLCIPPCEQ